jgi:hypothetical protein
VISNNPTSSPAGVAITLTTTGGTGGGAVTYSEMGGTTVCTIVGDQLAKVTPGTCRIRAIKAQDGANGVQFSQIVVFTFEYRVQAQLDINSELTGNVGNPISLSTSGGSGTGTVSYEIISGGTAAGTITGTSLTASTAGTIIIVATKQGDTQYAPVVSDPVIFTFTP